MQIVEKTITYTTGSNGEYVIYFQKLSKEDIDAQKRFIKSGINTKFDLLVIRDGFHDYRKANIMLEVSKTTIINANLRRL